MARGRRGIRGRREGQQQQQQQPQGRARTCGTHDPLDLLHVLQLWAQAAVHAEDLFVHDGGHGQAVEAVRKRLPQLDVVPPLACVNAPDREKGRGEGHTGQRQSHNTSPKSIHVQRLSSPRARHATYIRRRNRRFC